MKKKIFLLILCLIFINTTVFAAQVRKKDVYVSDSIPGSGTPSSTTTTTTSTSTSTIPSSTFSRPSKIITKYYLVTEKGNKVSTQEYDYLEEVNSNLFIARNDGKYGLINGLGQSLVPFEYQEIKCLKTNVLRFKYDEKFGLMTFSGSLILPANYSYLEKIDDRILKYNNVGNASAEISGIIKNSQVGLMDYSGNIITSPMYSYIDKIDNYLLRVIVSANNEQGGSQQDALPPGISSPTAGSDAKLTYVTGKYGIIDYWGKVVLNPEYDYLAKINSTLLKVKKGQSWGRVEFYHGNILNVMMDYQSYW